MPTTSPSRGLEIIPNLFTLLNLVFGCIAIIFILQNGITIVNINNIDQAVDIPEKIWMASLFIGLAAVIDFVDGFVARLFKATSEMGKQLDSLADLVSFGVAPGLIMYQFLRLSYAREAGGIDTSFIWLTPALIIPCAAAYRLARFNLDTSQSFSFKGLPVPSVGIFVASLPLIYWNINETWSTNLLLNRWFIYAVIVVLSFLMVSRIPLMSLKFKSYGFAANWPKYLLVIISIIALVPLQWLSVPVMVLAYVLISLFIKNKSV
jgi:CDP-diacylglycerol---serine O-phosphatidyltransferase